MTTLLRLYPGDTTLVFVAVLAFDVAAVVVLTWLLAQTFARRDAATRHGLWLATLVGVCLSPALIVAVERSGLALMRLPWPAMAPVPPEPKATQPRAVEPQPAPAIAELPGPEREPQAVAIEPEAPSVSVAPVVRDRPQSGLSPADRLRALIACACLLWVVGVAWLLVRLMVGWVAIARVVRCARPLTLDDPDLLREAARAAGLRKPPRLAESDAPIGPVATGILRPLILLPVDHLKDEAGLREILIHECAHLARRDPLVGLLQRLAEAVLWPHPCVHLLNRELSRAREEVCDNYVLVRGNRVRFARTLVDLSEALATAPGPRLAAFGLFPSHLALADRVTSLLDDQRRPTMRIRWRTLSPTVAILLCIGIAIAGLRPAEAARITPAVTADDPPTQKPAEDPPAKKPAEAIDITRVNEDEIAGRVVDTEGKPIEGVEVDAYEGRAGNVTQTDAHGRFRLNVNKRSLDPRTPGGVSIFDKEKFVEIRFRKDGYSPVLSLDKKPGTANWVVAMGNKTYFEGRVTDPQGKPVAGALVRADQGPKEPNRGYRITAIWTETKSDADGRYRLYVAPDAYKVQVRVPGVGVAELPQTDIRADEAKTLDIALKRGANFQAKMIHSLTGKPVPGVRMRDRRLTGVEAQADEHGVLTIADIVPETVAFVLIAPGFGRWWSEQGARAIDQEYVDERTGWQENSNLILFEMKPGMEPVTIVLEPDVTIRGRVTDPEGKPVAGAMPSAVVTGTGRTTFILGPKPTSATGPDGRYELHVPASKRASYSLYASDGRANNPRKWAGGVFPAIITNPGQVVEDCDIQLTRPATVRGRVVDDQGKPIAGRQVRAVDGAGLEGLGSITKTERDGKFELKFIRPGEHYIQVSPFSQQPAMARKGTSQTIELQPGEVKEGVDLVGRPVDRQPKSANASDARDVADRAPASESLVIIARARHASPLPFM